MKPNPKNSPRKNTVLNLLFLVISLALLAFLFSAPEETTPHTPKDSTHLKFAKMKKKEAEKKCTDCHAPGKESPLSPGHPPPNRCLFCHKRE